MFCLLLLFFLLVDCLLQKDQTNMKTRKFCENDCLNNFKICDNLLLLYISNHHYHLQLHYIPPFTTTTTPTTTTNHEPRNRTKHKKNKKKIQTFNTLIIWLFGGKNFHIISHEENTNAFMFCYNKHTYIASFFCASFKTSMDRFYNKQKKTSS